MSTVRFSQFLHPAVSLLLPFLTIFSFLVDIQMLPYLNEVGDFISETVSGFDFKPFAIDFTGSYPVQVLSPLSIVLFLSLLGSLYF